MRVRDGPEQASPLAPCGVLRPIELADMQKVPRFKIEELGRHLFKLLDLQNGGKRRVWVQPQGALTSTEACFSQKAPALGAPTDETDHLRGNHARANTDPRGRGVGCVHVCISHGVNARAKEGDDGRHLPQLPPSRK